MEAQAHTTLIIHCVQTISETLANVPEVVSVQVDLATKTAQVTATTEIFPFARVERALAAAGYPSASHPGVRRGKPLPLSLDQKRNAREGGNFTPIPKGLDSEPSGGIDRSRERTID